MRRSDDVFFFTLIDFLLQVFFFGLLLFVVWQVQQASAAKGRAAEEAAKDKLLAGAGVSSITELSDFLTKMAPLDQLRGMSDFIVRSGGINDVKAAVAAASAAGGVQKVGQLEGQLKLLNARISELEGGWGKVSCVPNIVVNGKLQPKSIARVLVEDGTITLEDPQPEMMNLLATHGLEFSSIQRLSLSAFRSTFAPVVTKQPECRYFLSVTTRTQFLEPMRAVWSAFRTQ
jgi:membrane-associated protease RseP (regulator of RpoE activity)